jgi:hypothetical protein
LLPHSLLGRMMVLAGEEGRADGGARGGGGGGAGTRSAAAFGALGVYYIKLSLFGRMLQVSTCFGNFFTKLPILGLAVTDCAELGLIAF